MKIEEILPILRAGEAVDRVAWGDKWIYLDQGKFFFVRDSGDEGVWIPSSADLLATDWEVLGKKEERAMSEARRLSLLSGGSHGCYDFEIQKT